jgi:hypothetical protein
MLILFMKPATQFNIAQILSFLTVDQVEECPIDGDDLPTRPTSHDQGIRKEIEEQARLPWIRGQRPLTGPFRE